MLALLATRVLSARTLGYGFIVLQYGGFFLLTALSVRGFLRLSTFPNVAHAATLTALSALLLLASAFCHMMTSRWYENGVAKAQQFQRSHRLRTVAPATIHHPYLLLEWKRVLRSKELIFYTTIKNLVTIALLAGLFRQRVQLLLPDATLLTLVLLSVSCAINTIASTAYSSDASRHCYDFLPIDGARLFLWKTLVAAFWGLPLVVLVWLVSVCVVRPAFAESLLLLLYALTSALLCAALGVWLDQRMPRSPQSTNELLHGNLSKVCVLAAALTLSISLCRVAESHALIAAVTLNLVLVLFSAARFFLRKEDHA